MSALPPQADIRRRIEHVCYMPKADMPLAGVAASTDCQANILFWIFSEGSSGSALPLKNGTIGPFIYGTRGLLTVEVDARDA